MVCAIYINININIKSKNPLYYTLKKSLKSQKVSIWFDHPH